MIYVFSRAASTAEITAHFDLRVQPGIKFNTIYKAMRQNGTSLYNLQDGIGLYIAL